MTQKQKHKGNEQNEHWSVKSFEFFPSYKYNFKK